MASNPSGDGGHGLELDCNKPPSETLEEMKSATDGVEVEGSQGDETGARNLDGDVDREKDEEEFADGDSREKRDAMIEGEIVEKDGSFVAVAVETKGEKKTDGDLVENDQRVHYKFRLQEIENGFGFDDLVWGKIKGHPWWPGQVFDPKYASEMALKRQKKDHFLVAYFGDKTFAWVPGSQLKPLQAHFSAIQKQSSMKLFVNAFNGVLEEISRRVELGMACHCLADEIYAGLKYKKVENVGIREGTGSVAVDRSMYVDAFQPEALLEYIWALAACPFGGFDRLELTIATVHLKAFYRSKGHRELAVFVSGSGLVRNDSDIPLSSVTAVRRVRYRSRRVSELMEEKDVDYSGNGNKGGPKGNIFVRASDFKRSKDKGVGKEADSATEAASSARARSLRIRDRISRAASQLTESSAIHKSDDVRLQDSVAKRNHRKGAYQSSKAVKEKDVAAEEYPSPSEMLSQLCLVAKSPEVSYQFLPMIIGFFTKLRDSVSSNFSENQGLLKSMERKGGRKKKAANSNPPSPQVSEPDYVQDTYWSDIVLESEREPEAKGQKRKGSSQEGQKKKKTVGEPPTDVDLPSAKQHGMLGGASDPSGKQEVEGGRVISNIVETIKEDTPTTLILSFNESDALPSVADLIKIFSPYGPLREEETEILRKTKRAKVVFKYHLDAEKAYSSAGKYSVFGTALVSYRLRYLPSSNSSPATSPQDENDAMPMKDDDLEPHEDTVTNGNT